MDDINNIISQLGRFTIRDVITIEQLAKENFAAKEFFLKLIAHKVNTSHFAKDIIPNWSENILLEVVIGWLKVNHVLSKTLEQPITFEVLRSEIENYKILKTSNIIRADETKISHVVASDTLRSLQLSEAVLKSSTFLEISSIAKLTENYNQAVVNIAKATDSMGTKRIERVLDGVRNSVSDLTAIRNQINSSGLASALMFDASQWMSKIALIAMTDHLSTLDTLVKHTSPVSQINTVIAAQMPTIKSVLKAAEMSALTVNTLNNIAISNVGGIIGFDKNYQQSIRGLLGSVTNAYSDYVQSLETKKLDIVTIKPVLIESPAREIFSISEFVEAISIDSTDDKVSQDRYEQRTQFSTENDEALHALLSELDPRFGIMLEGATQALYSTNVDRVRHFAISFRELFTHIIHTLAPDEAIRAWSADTQHFVANKPTRKARLLFICRNVNHPPLDKFLKKDIDAALELLDICQEGTHSVEIQMNKEQLLVLKYKMESTLRFILEVS